MTLTPFNRWMREQDGRHAKPEQPAEPDPDSLPANLRFVGGTGDDRYHARCCCCDRWGPLYVGIDEIGPIDSYEHYCGGSPRCCP